MLFDFSYMTFHTKEKLMTIECSALLVPVLQRKDKRNKRSASKVSWYDVALDTRIYRLFGQSSVVSETQSVHHSAC